MANTYGIIILEALPNWMIRPKRIKFIPLA